MSVVKFKHSGNFSSFERFADKVSKGQWHKYYLNNLGRKGVKALSDATPRRTGKTAESWSYRIVEGKDSIRVIWENDNIVINEHSRASVAVLIQYGHATRNGGFVEGIDYINPALRPLFDKFAKDAWEEVTR